MPVDWMHGLLKVCAAERHGKKCVPAILSILGSTHGFIEVSERDKITNERINEESLLEQRELVIWFSKNDTRFEYLDYALDGVWKAGSLLELLRQGYSRAMRDALGTVESYLLSHQCDDDDEGD